MEPVTLTHSAMALFRQCPRRYEHRYVNKIVPAFWQDSAPLRFGTAFHKWLEAWYYGEPAPLTPNLGPADAACLAGAAKAYSERYPTESWHSVAVEHQFEQAVINPDTGAKSPLFRLKGKVDLVVQIDGELWIVEHKTSTATTVGDLERVGIDAQVLTYADCIGREVGTPVAGVIYNVVKRCQLRLKQSETPAEYTNRVAEWYKGDESMLRERARIDPRHIEQNRKNIWMTVQMMHQCRRAGYYPQNAGVTTGACAKWGRECEYAPLCRQLNAPHAMANYKHQEPHSELEDESDGA